MSFEGRAGTSVPRFLGEAIAVSDSGSDESDSDFQLLGLPVSDEADLLRARVPFELLASQFVDELRSGSRPSVEHYARRFPPHAAKIREVFPVLAMLELARVNKESRAMRRNMPGTFPFSRLGQCELLQEIGRGGMGVVFRARDLNSSHIVALKVLPWRVSLAPEWVARFEREAETARSLHHPHIVPVFRWGQDSGYSFIVMQFIRGVGLDRVIESLGRSPSEVALESLIPNTERSGQGLTLHSSAWQEFVRIGIQALQALRAAHGAGICHNDIKPGNLLLESGGHVWVADFGLSQPLRTGVSAGVRGLERSGVFGGTLRYMAPERFRGVNSAGADLYSLGATLYELALQCAPFNNEDSEALREQILREAPLQPRDLCRDFPRGLETIILNCLQKDPQDRYQNADALLEDFLRFTHGRRIRSTRRSRVTVLFSGVSRWFRGMK